MKLKINIILLFFLFVTFILNAEEHITQYYIIETNIKNDNILSESINQVKNYFKKNQILINSDYKKKSYVYNFVYLESINGKTLKREVLIENIKKFGNSYKGSIASFNIHKGKKRQTDKSLTNLTKINVANIKLNSTDNNELSKEIIEEFISYAKAHSFFN